jgi:antitoxin component YwqK of YwqJK toxin-antitoxin module
MPYAFIDFPAAWANEPGKGGRHTSNNDSMEKPYLCRIRQSMPKRSLFVVAILFFFLLNEGFAQTEFTAKHDSINWVDAKGMKQGKFRKTDKQGKKIYEGFFKNNKPYGTFTYFDEDGKITAISIFDKDGKTCRSTLFHRNGNVMAKGRYVNQQRDSIWCFYTNADTLISRETYLTGKKSGLCWVYYSGRKIAEESTWKNGVQEGPWKQYLSNGQMKCEGAYKNGCMDGIINFYCESGKKTIQAVYKNCLPEGKWVTYDCGTGAVKKVYTYIKGHIQGEDTDKELEDELKKGMEEYKEQSEKERSGMPIHKEDKDDKDGGY